jgi:hypothetical protein
MITSSTSAMTSSKIPEDNAEKSPPIEPNADQAVAGGGALAPGGAPPPMPPVAGQVTREQLARAVGKDERTIRRWERTRLAPAVSLGPDGVHRFDMQRVSELLEVRERHGPTAPDAYDGEMAREAFRLFDEGLDQVDVVKQAGFDPRAVKAMYREWASMRGGFFVPAEVVAKIASLPWLDGPNLALDGSACKLLTCIERTRPRERCTRCEHNQPELCAECARDIAVHQAKARAAEARLRKDLEAQEKEQAQTMKLLEKSLRNKRNR